MIGGSTYGCAATCPTITSPNLVDRLEAAGLSWKAYMESQNVASGCVTTTQLPYYPRHNPFVQFRDITNNTTRCNKIVLANPTSCGSTTDCTLLNDLNSFAAPNFMWLTPNVCNDMHGNSTCTNGCTSPSTTCIVDGDNYLSTLVPSILNSKTFNTTRSALFITFDEGTGFCPLNGSSEECMYAVWAGPVARTGFVTSRLYNHYSFLKTVEINWNLTSLTTNDANATPMTEFFSSYSGASPPTPPAGAYFDHVVVIMMENEGMNEICNRNPPPCIGSNSPYMSSLANNYSISQQYLPLISTSEPNYYGILGASIFGCPTNCYPPVGGINAPNLVDRFEAVGLSWKGYMENQNGVGCDGTTHEPYEHEHNGFVSFQDIYNNSTRCGKIARANPTSCGSVTDCVLVNDLNSVSSANFMWLTPNDCDNMHADSICTTGNGYNGCTSAGTNCIKKGDDYLKSLVPNILNSYAFQNQRSALFIVFDEGVGTSCPLNGSSEDCLYAVWAGPVAKTGFSSPQLYNQYSLTKTIEVNWNLTTLTTNDAAAIPMTEFFRPLPNFTISATSPGAVNAGQSTNSVITVTSVNGFSGTVSLTDNVPGGLTCGAISPSSLIGSGTATLSCSSNTAGRYTANVTGTSNSLVHSASATFNFVNFTITASSPAPVNVGQSPSSTITIAALNGFAGIVTLTDTIPFGLTCGAITPTSIAGSGTATVSCSATFAANYTLSLTGSSGSLTHSTTAVFRFQNFTINASSPPAANVGSSPSSTITIAPLNGFAGTVSLTDIIPSGLFCGSITPTSLTGSGSATVSCTSSSAGNYTLTVTGTSGSLFHSATAIFRFQDFNITTSIPTAVKAGVSATSTITVTALNHFSGTVSLTDTVPNGLTCGAITPGSVTGSGTATVSCSATVAGNYTLTITGASTSLMHGTTATFMVQDFTVSTSSLPPAYAGVSVPVTITVAALNHFNGLVNLADTVPSGLTCGAITPTSVTGSGTATVSCNGAVAGNYTLTITATSTPLVHTATAFFQFQDFTITASSPAAAKAGVSATSTITIVSLNHFAGVVSLTDMVDSGLTCGGITPSSVTGSGTATVLCSASLAGNYTLTITGTSTPLVHTATATFMIQDFTISANSPAAVMARVSATSTITVTSLNHFAGVVSLTDTVPAGLTCGTISPSSITGSGNSTVSCTSSVAGNYTLTITGTSTPLVHSSIAIFMFQDFIIAANSPAEVNAGSSAVSTITITPLNGFTGSVALTDIAPSGSTCGLITPNSVSGGSGTATVSCSATVAGNYTLTITGTNTPLVHNATAVFKFGDFTIGATSPAAVNVTISATSTVTVSSVNHFAGTVMFTDSVPSGLTCGALSPSGVNSSGTATVSCTASIAGNYTLTITGTSASLVHSTAATFMFQDFTIVVSSPPTANVNVSVSSTITITALNQFAGVVSLTETLPSGLACGMIAPTSVTGSGSATVSCSASVAGNYTLTVTGTSGSLVHSATATFQFQDFTLSISSPASIEVGVFSTSTVTITALNHFAGTVSLTYSLPLGVSCGVITPNRLTGSGTATVSCSATAAGTYTLTFRGTAGLLTHSASSTIQAVDFSITGIASPQVSPVGTNATSSITLTSLNGYSGNVTLTAAVQPPLVGGAGGGGGRTRLTMAAPSGQPVPSFNPVSIFLSSGGTGQSNLTIILSPSVPAGNYLITVMASDGTIVRYVQFTLAATDFILSSQTTSLTMNAGSNSTQTLNLQSLNGFQGNLALSSSFSPTGPLATLTPSTVYLTAGGNSSLLTIVVPSNTAPGTYTLTVQAISGTLSHTIYITVTVQSGLTAILSRVLSSNPSASIAASAILALVSLFSIRSAQTIAKTKRRAPHSTTKLRRYSKKPRHATWRPYSITLGPLWTSARDPD